MGIFKGATPQLEGVWSSNQAGIIAGAGMSLGVVTQVQIQFSQTINRIYDLAKTGTGDEVGHMYFIGGRAEGRMTLGRLIGPKGSGCDFYKDYGDICAIKPSLEITFKGSGASKTSCAGQSSTYTMTHPICVQVGITQNAQDTMINENAQFMFSDLVCV
jgi:hypothetical protein|tara:strand:- start:30773 stop:31249 length:477 start_codon:yes stop_codon:yes gene_type:complete